LAQEEKPQQKCINLKTPTVENKDTSISKI